jgi:hypothetical protein
MGTIQGSAAASAAAIVGGTAGSLASAPTGAPRERSPGERVADADRERAIAQLREHMLVGRLTAEEFEERLASAQRARTWADLDAVSSDLPASPAVLPRAASEGLPPDSGVA